MTNEERARVAEIKARCAAATEGGCSKQEVSWLVETVERQQRVINYISPLAAASAARRARERRSLVQLREDCQETLNYLEEDHAVLGLNTEADLERFRQFIARYDELIAEIDEEKWGDAFHVIGSDE